MANPSRGEVDFWFGEKHLTFKFTNRGQRECEDFLGVQGAALARKIDAGIGAELKTGLFLGATRKYHAREYPNIVAVDNFMDEFEDAKVDTEDPEVARDMELELQAALLAAFFRDDKKRIKRILSGEAPIEEPSEEVPAVEESPDEVPKAKTKAPKKEERSLTEVGTSS